MGLKLCSFASGSKGNCCYVSDGRTDILIDMGISALRAENCLRVLGANFCGLNILVTHSHSDHIGGLKVFCKKHSDATVVCQKESAYAVQAECDVLPRVQPREFTVGTLFVTAIPVSHDVPCFGYIVSGGQKKIGVVTDIGVVSQRLLEALQLCDIVMLECNHDVQKLKSNPKYTAALKARIHSEQGHLSNVDCASACAFLAANGVKNFVLAHMSEENNEPALAVGVVERAVRDAGVSDVRIVAARQDGMSGLFEVC